MCGQRTSTNPCKILTQMASSIEALHAPGMSRLRKADVPIAMPKHLQQQTV